MNTAIELTSLLDVIFIVLMIVVCNQQINLTEKQQQSEAMMQEALEMQDEASDIIAQREMYKEQQENIDTLAGGSVVVYVDYVPSEITSRRIRILAGSEELPEISVAPGNEDEAFGEFERVMTGLIEADPESPIIVTVDTTQILYRDEKRVNETVDRLLNSYSNLFVNKKAAAEE